jgi:hypothetical protein
MSWTSRSTASASRSRRLTRLQEVPPRHREVWSRGITSATWGSGTRHHQTIVMVKRATAGRPGGLLRSNRDANDIGSRRGAFAHSPLYAVGQGESHHVPCDVPVWHTGCRHPCVLRCVRSGRYRGVRLAGRCRDCAAPAVLALDRDISETAPRHWLVRRGHALRVDTPSGSTIPLDRVPLCARGWRAERLRIRAPARIGLVT